MTKNVSEEYGKFSLWSHLVIFNQAFIFIWKVFILRWLLQNLGAMTKNLFKLLTTNRIAGEDLWGKISIEFSHYKLRMKNDSQCHKYFRKNYAKKFYPQPSKSIRVTSLPRGVFPFYKLFCKFNIFNQIYGQISKII